MLSQKKNDVTVDVDSKDSSSKHDALLLFGINMGILPRSFQLIFCIFMIFLLFVLYGYCQEWIFRVPEIKKNGMFVTLVQFAFYSLFGLIEQTRNRSSGRK